MIVQSRNEVSVFIFKEKEPYRIINILFLIIIVLVFVYSLVFSPDKNNYPIQSEYSAITERTSISTGLSHGFSCIMRGRFQEAYEYNNFSIQLFCFFLIQLVMRGIVLLYLKHTDRDERGRTALVDSIVSTGLFVIFFYPFLKDIFQ
jgi:hypothetical protein